MQNDEPKINSMEGGVECTHPRAAKTFHRHPGGAHCPQLGGSSRPRRPQLVVGHSYYHWSRTNNPSRPAGRGQPDHDVWKTTLKRPSLNGIRRAIGTPKVLDLSRSLAGRPRSNASRGGRIQVCNATYGNNGWIEIAQIWISGGHITQGTSKQNDTYFSRARITRTGVATGMVICQEIAHDFGLGHQERGPTYQNTGLVHGLHQRPERRHLRR